MNKFFVLQISIFLFYCTGFIWAQPTSYVRHFDFDPGWYGGPAGGYVVFDYSNKEMKATTTIVGGIPASYSMVQVWWGGSSWGIRIKEAPYLKFRAKRTTPKAQNFSINYAFTDGSTQGVSHTIPGGLTAVYQDFFFDLSSDIVTLQLGGKVVKNCFEFQWTLTPSTDDGLFVDDFMIGDSANPCPAKTPTLSGLPASINLNFNANTPYDITLYAISDGNGSTKTPITVSATSSDPGIIAAPAVIYLSPDSIGSIQLLGAQPPKSGTATITVTVSDTSYCNSKIIKTVPVTVKAEALWFVLSKTTMTVNTGSGEQIVDINGITNIGKNNVPDNYHGLTLAAIPVSNGSLLTSFSDAPVIDTLTGSALFKFTVDPAANDKSVIKINFVLTSASGKVTIPGMTGHPLAVLTITVNKAVAPCPAAMPGAGDVSVCSGSAAALSATGGKSYRWFNVSSGGTVLDTHAVFVTPKLYSGATYYVANFDSCESSRKAVAVSINSLSSPKITALANTHFVCNSAPEQLSATPSGGVFSGNAVELGFFVPAQAKINHINTIYYTYNDTASGCSGIDSLHVYVFPCIGLEDDQGNGIIIYPNPSDGLFTMRIKEVDDEFTIQITDGLGRILYEDRKSNINTYEKQIDLSGISAGVYLVRVKMKDKILLSKVIIK